MNQNLALKKTENKEIANKKGKTTKEKVENTYTEELILGVCSPIGSNREIVIESIKNRLKDYDYNVTIIKLSKFIEEYSDKEYQDEAGKTEAYTKLMHKIEGGDSLRKKFNNNSILVELAIKQIREERKVKETTSATSRRVCYIIDSLKNIEELKLLRSIYRELFYLFSIFSPENERIEKLIEKGLSKSEAEDIISTDEFEDILHGQNVRDTFIEADFFVRISETNKSEIKEKIEKYFHLIFNSDIITPNNHETAMYFAKSAAGNSACLSRQVGATITDSNGVTIARGWNDVPKFGGNLYRDTDINPKRCKDLGYCSNIKHRDSIFDDIEENVNKLLNENNENEEKSTLKVVKRNDLTKEIMSIIKNSRFKNIIEYSRSIHAEMHAIIIGSQLTGDKMVGGNLYCTTYPCHNCARHIILAGIKNIYYIEPYKKSLGMTLHNDALTENENESNKVRLLPYDGVAPRRYLDFFSMNNSERKKINGEKIVADLKTIKPKMRLSLQAIPTLENQAIQALVDCGLITIEEDN